jgi:hypothetical protein
MKPSEGRRHLPTTTQRRVACAKLPSSLGELEVGLQLHRPMTGAEAKVLVHPERVDELARFILPSGSQMALNSRKARIMGQTICLPS